MSKIPEPRPAGQRVYVLIEGPGTVVADHGFSPGPGRRVMDSGVDVRLDSDGEILSCAHAQVEDLDDEPCDDGCHLAGGEPVMIQPQPDAAEYGEPADPHPCCPCWTWQRCETGVGIATCYHVPRCSWPSPAGWRRAETFGRLVPAREEQDR